MNKKKDSLHKTTTTSGSITSVNSNTQINPQDLFDGIVKQLSIDPIWVAIENLSKQYFNALDSILWIAFSERSIFFSPSKGAIIPYLSPCLINFVKKNAVIFSISPQSSHPSFDSTTDAHFFSSSSSVLYIPILSRNQEVLAILHIGRSHPSFSNQEVTLAKYFFKKFMIYSAFILSPHSTLSTALDLVQLSTFPAIVLSLTETLRHHFHCRRAEIWLHNPSKSDYYRFEPDRELPTLFDPQKSGIAGFCLSGHSTLVKTVRRHPSYSECIDGYHDEPLLACSHFDELNRCWAVILRGHPHHFKGSDASELAAVIPFLVKSMSGSMSPPQFEAQLDEYEQRLTALLEVAEILSGVLDIDVLVKTIMERACSLLNAERCSLFLVDSNHQELVTRFHGGLDKDIRIPIGRGIVGHTATTGDIINIPDAYLDERFDKTVDIATGFRTRAILSVPIFNNRGEIAGVTEMINKISDNNDEYNISFPKSGIRTVNQSQNELPSFTERGKEKTDKSEKGKYSERSGAAFNEDDTKMLMAFNVFCGISLDNAKLYNASINLTRQLRTVVGLSTQLGHSEAIRSLLLQILEKMSHIVNASRTSLFLYDAQDRTFTQYINIGDRVTYGDVFAQEMIAGREIKIFTEDEISTILNQNKSGATQEYDEIMGRHQNQFSQGFNPAGNIINKGGISSSSSITSISALSVVSTDGLKSNRISTLIDRSTKLESVSVNVNQAETMICCIPLFTSDQNDVGVIELETQSKILTEDLKLLDCFAVFASIAIERAQLRDFATLGQNEIELKQWIPDEERGLEDVIPKKLELHDTTIWNNNFNSVSFDGSGHIKVIFAIFHRFNFQKEFSISNEKLFRFIIEIRSTYNKVPYHNWRHAVDVTQFVVYQVIQGEIDSELTKFELFALIIASICHDANHDGFSNVFNVKAATPLGILYKNQSVLETHHCQTTINVLSKEECDIFSKFDADQYAKIWSIVIQLILATDMARHFDLLKQFNTLYDDESVPSIPNNSQSHFLCKGQFTMENYDHRILIMQLLLKAGDISNVARPFELANQWCDVLCEEFFRQGDLEMASGMEYTSPLNDRASLDKPKSQIGFYSFVCLPLYQAIMKAIPKLECNVKQVESNLVTWKEATKAK